MEAIRQMASFSVVDNVLPDILHRVAVLATQTIDGADFAGLMLSVDGRPGTPVYTDDEAPELDSTQYETGIGPCLDSYRNAEIYTIPSTQEDERWRPFSETCVEHGVLSTMSVPVITTGESVGALNFYSRRERAFDAAAETLGTAFADQAAIVIVNATAYWKATVLGEQLSQALESRVIIEQAKGLLMATGLSSAAAFDVLRKASQRENRKLNQIAGDLVAEAERRAASKAPPAER